MLRRDILIALVVSVVPLLQGTCWASDSENIKVVTDWQEDEGPIRVDCWNIEIVGNGFGGNLLSCEERLSLYALFNCFPMKRCSVETTCPEWEGLQADIDWDRVAELIDAQQAKLAADKKKRIEELDQLINERKKDSRPTASGRELPVTDFEFD